MNDKILLIEDEPQLAGFASSGLRREGYNVIVAGDGETGLEMAFSELPDLIILDIMLPGIDGLDVCRRIREGELQTPILMLTAKDAIPDKVAGLEAGADDYMVKPYAFEELLARVRALQRRRAPIESDTPLIFADLTLSPTTRMAQRSARNIELTAKEYDLLELFMRHPNQVLTRDHIYDRIWGYDFGGENNIIEVYIRYLRSKLEAEGEPRLLHTIRGVGYALREAPVKLDLSGGNPYIVGAPVPPDKFYGRKKMLQKILASIKSGNHVAIYGERRIGKTSLLHQLEYLLRRETNPIFVPLFIQMQLLSEDDFFGALIDEVLKAAPTSIKESLPSLVRQMSPQPYKGVHLLQDLETVIQAWNNETAKPIQLVFLLDEGDRLNGFNEETQMRLRGLLQKPLINRHVRLVWSGVGIDRTWHSDTSPWFNLFKTEFHLSGLEPEEARRLILEPVAGVYDYEEEAVAKILELTQHKPYIIQWLCSSCIDNLQEQGRMRGRITVQGMDTVWTNRQNRKEPIFTYESTQAPVQIAETQAKYDTTKDSSS